MARKRKRSGPSACNDIEEPQKRARLNSEAKLPSYPTLCLYYTHISTLRDYLLLKLPKSSKTRRRRIASAENGALDETLICIAGKQQSQPDLSRSKDFEAFSQQVSLTAGSSNGVGSASQSDLIDFAIWLLFHRVHRHAYRPPHMLCHGYQRASNSRQANEEHGALAGIPGVVSHYPNGNVNILKDAAWTGILSLLGKEGERIMLDIVLDCGTFVAVDGGMGNCFQLSGTRDYSPHMLELTYSSRYAYDRAASQWPLKAHCLFNHVDSGIRYRAKASVRGNWQSTSSLSQSCCYYLCSA